jgi:hypothetical protein
MIQTIRMKKIVDRETSPGIIARTEYEEKEMDDLAITLAGNAGKKISNKYWEGDYKVFHVEDVTAPEETPLVDESDVVPEPVPEPIQEPVTQETQIPEEAPVRQMEDPIVLSESDITKIKTSRKRKNG